MKTRCKNKQLIKRALTASFFTCQQLVFRFGSLNQDAKKQDWTPQDSVHWVRFSALRLLDMLYLPITQQANAEKRCPRFNGECRVSSQRHLCCGADPIFAAATCLDLPDSNANRFMTLVVLASPRRAVLR